MEISKKDLGVSDKEYNLWLKICEDERLASEVSIESPKTAFRLYHCFIDNPFGGKLSREENRKNAIRLGNYFLQENPRGRYHDSIKDSLENLELRGRRNENEGFKDLEDFVRFDEFDISLTKERIINLIEERGIKGSQFLSSLNLKLPYTSHILGNQAKLGIRRLNRLCKAGDFNIDYLISGKGPKFIPMKYKVNSEDFLMGINQEDIGKRINELRKKRIF